MSNLWVPEHLSDTLTVTLDASEADESTWEGMMMVNQAGIDWLAGRLDTGTYCDMLEHVGIDPLGFLKPVQEHVRLLTL